VTSENPTSDIAPRPRSAVRSPAAILIFILTAVLGLTIDLWSKSYAWSSLVVDPHAQLERDPASGHLIVDSYTARPIPGWLHLRVTVNEGAVFGRGQGLQKLFALVSVAAIGFLGYLFITSGRRWFYQIILGMLLAGVLGNLYDRMVYSYVRDMLYMLPGKYIFGREAFPWIFNFADTLLCVGVGLMVLYSFFTGEPGKASEKKDAAVQPAQS
jgi:signal peptidase II